MLSLSLRETASSFVAISLQIMLFLYEITTLVSLARNDGTVLSLRANAVSVAIQQTAKPFKKIKHFGISLDCFVALLLAMTLFFVIARNCVAVSWQSPNLKRPMSKFANLALDYLNSGDCFATLAMTNLTSLRGDAVAVAIQQTAKPLIKSSIV